MAKKNKQEEAKRLYYVSVYNFNEHDQTTDELMSKLIREGLLTTKGYEEVIKIYSGIEDQLGLREDK